MITPAEIINRLELNIRYRAIRMLRRPLRSLVILVVITISAVLVRRTWNVMHPLSATIWWRVIGFAGIPLVMAWAGLHLAADSLKSKKKKDLFRALFICLAALGIFIVAVVEKKSDIEHQGEVAYQKQQYEYQRDQNTRMTQKLEDGQAASTLLAQQFKDFRNDLKSMQGKPSSANPTGLSISVPDISRLEQRAQQAENAANLLSTYYSQQSKIQSWPFGAAGVDAPGQPGQLHKWFLENFPEASDINGQDRFFLYYLIKHDRELFLTRSWQKELDDMYYKTFPGIGGAPALESETRLQRLGYISADFPIVKLREPYYSRLKGVQIP